MNPRTLAIAAVLALALMPTPATALYAKNTLLHDGGDPIVEFQRPFGKQVPGQFDACEPLRSVASFELNLFATPCGDGWGGAPSPDGDLATSGPSCSKSGDDKGFGGTHISCKYSCPQHAELLIAVKATDAGASTYGNTDCGGADASCAESTPACANVSDELTSSREEDARCYGNTDEFWDSPATVACSAVGVDPCLLIEDLCEDQSFATAMRDFCADSNPDIDPGVLDLLLAAVDLDRAASFVVFSFDADGGTAIRAQAIDAVTCVAEQFTL